MYDPKSYHEALASVSPSYKAYADTKLKGWGGGNSSDRKNNNGNNNDRNYKNNNNNNSKQNQNQNQQKQQQNYHRPKVTLGASIDYARHYAKYLVPKLKLNLLGDEENEKEATTTTTRRFLDFGAAPGGLCRALLELWSSSSSSSESDNNNPSTSSSSSIWKGVAVTLHPQDGGLALDDETLQHNVSSSSSVSSHRLQVEYQDVCEAETFISSCVALTKTTAEKEEQEKEGEEEVENLFDFVNCGIVLDAVVKSKKTGRVIGYGEQLHTQLLTAFKCLRRDGKGDLMIALRFDHPTLPETIPTIELFRKHSSQMFVLPTMYTETAGRKQFYLLIRGVRLTEKVCDDVREIWDAGKARYKEFVKQTFEKKQQQQQQQASAVSASEEKGEDTEGKGASRRERQGEEEQEGEKVNEKDKKQQQEKEKADLEKQKEELAATAEKERQEVKEMVQHVYNAVGPSLDKFCNIIEEFLSRTFAL